MKVPTHSTRCLTALYALQAKNNPAGRNKKVIMRTTPWEIARPNEKVEVSLGCSFELSGGSLRPVPGHPSTLIGIPFDRPVIGYGGSTINTLQDLDQIQFLVADKLVCQRREQKPEGSLSADIWGDRRVELATACERRLDT
jgi:hypothetical protein